MLNHGDNNNKFVGVSWSRIDRCILRGTFVNKNMDVLVKNMYIHTYKYILSITMTIYFFSNGIVIFYYSV